MAFKRGNRILEVEVARLQSWVETADPDLYGEGNDPGVIRQFRDEHAEKAANRRYVRNVVTACGLFSAVPAVIKLLEVLHVIAK